MRLSNHGPGSPSRRRNWAFRPENEALESRKLLTTLDLAGTQTVPYGVEMVGKANTGSGYTVTDVGDVTKAVGGGYDAYVIGAPGLTAPSVNGAPGFSGTSTAYLVLGSNSVGTTTAVPYNTLSNVPLTQDNKRGGDLGMLGQFGELNPQYQINPTVTQPTTPANTPNFPGYNYNGLTFTTGLDPASGLGYSVAALGNIDGSGYNSFAIGAPAAGKVYIIYGSTALAALVEQNTAANKAPIDLDLNPTTNTYALAVAGVKEVILTDSSIGTGQFGYSVAGLGNYFNYGLSAQKDIAIGAPGADVFPTGTPVVPGGTIPVNDPINANTGAVYAISGLALQGVASGTIVNLANITTTNRLGIRYDGPTVGSRAGASVSTGLNFDHATTTSGGFEIDDLLIGAPGAVPLIPTVFPFGQAFLVYGDQQFANTNSIAASTIGSVQKLTQIGTALPVGTTLNYPLEGVIFQNPLVGSFLFGFSVSTAGDYNGDGVDDVIIGAPEGQGTASIFYGISEFTPAVTNPPTATHFVGAYPRSGSVGSTPIPPGTAPISPPLTFQGAVTGDLAGFSVSYIGDIPGQGINGVLIGAPQSNAGQGQAYVIPGNYQTPTTPATANFPMLVPLSTAIVNPVYAAFALIATNSFTGTTTNPPYLGTSISGRSPLIPITGPNSQQYSLDQDNVPDVIVGVPGFNLTNPANGNLEARHLAGEVFGLEGSLLPQTAPNNVILSAAGIGTNSPTGPYTITSSGALTIYLFSAAAGTNGSPAFNPSTDLTSPVTLVINGVTFTNVALTPSPSATDAGEVKFTLSAAQVAQLALVVSTSPITFTIRGKTNATPPVVFIARALNDVIVTAGGSGGAAGASISGPTAAQILAPPVFTGDLAGLPFPPISTLSNLISYQPLPVQLAYEQYLPAPGFQTREEVYHHPSKGKTAHQAPAGTVLNVAAIGHSENRYSKVNTLQTKVFTRGKYKIGRATTFTHKVKVIPASEQTQSYPG